MLWPLPRDRTFCCGPSCEIGPSVVALSGGSTATLQDRSYMLLEHVVAFIKKRVHGRKILSRAYNIQAVDLL